MKNRKIITALTVLSILATTNVQALTKNQVCTYTDAYKEYMKLSDSEKKKYNEPIMCVSQRTTSPSKLLKGSLPSSYNTYGGVVKNQQTTDTCWAFSTTSVLEAFLHTHKNLDKVFSPTHMDYMLSQSFTNLSSNPFGYNRQVNTGGNFSMAANYMINQYGPVLESRVPFELNPGNVNSSSIIGLTPQVDVNGVELTILDEVTGRCTPGLVDIMKNAIYTTGPIAATMNRNDAYLNSSNGAYVNLSSPMYSNHAVMLIGWDDSYSKNNFNEGNRPSQDGAFIAQNSYGTNYGNNGLIYISYEDTTLCEQYFAIRDVDTTIEDNKYSYDELGVSGGELPANAVMAIYNKKASGVEQIKEVTFATAGTGNYDIYLYRGNAKKDNILISEMEKIGSGRISYSGYQTHKITSNVYIAPTTPVYSIVVKYTADSVETTIPVAIKSSLARDAGSINNNIVIEPGKTYAYTGIWEDLYYYLADNGIRLEASIKVFTDNSSADYLELATPTVQYNDTNASLNFVTSNKNYSKVKSITVTNPNGRTAVVQSYHENTSNGKYTSLDVVLTKNGDLVTGRYNLTLTLEDNSTTSIGFDLSPVVISNIYIDADIVQVLVGGKTQVKYHFDGENIDLSKVSVSFSSSDESIATVDNYGVVTTLDYGTVEITVTDEFGNSDTCVIEIDENWAEGIEISPKSATWIQPNTTLQLTQNLGDDLDWHSSDESVLRVDNTGKVTAVSEGVAVISILIDDWIIDSYELKVSNSAPVDPLNITITDTRTSYISGKTYDFDFTCGKSSCLSLVEITSSNKDVATITSDGKINALKPGTTTIKVKDLNTDTNKTKQITVTYPLSNVSITNGNFSVNKGSTLQTTINYTKNVSESITESSYIKYSSSDTSIATVNASGLITGVKGGKVTIYVKDNYDTILAQKSLTVIERTITLNESDQTIIMGNNKTLNYTCNYTDLETCLDQLVWTSSNEEVATVNNGVVTAIKPGTTTIKVADKTNSTLYKQFTLTVGYIFNSLNITTKDSTIVVGSNKTIEVSYDYVGNNNPLEELTWTSSNREVATVNNGIVTALKSGTTTITVSDPLNKYPKSIEITVVNEIENFRITTGNKTILTEETTTISYEGDYYGTSTLESAITWNSTNEEVATVNNGLVTPVGIGTTTIEIYSKQNVLLGSVQITVNYVFNSLTINNKNTKLVKGQTSTLDLSYEYIGKNNNPLSLLTFTSENTNVATVDETGTITPLSKGTTTITVSDPLNKYTTTKVFTVVDEINSFNITTEATSLYYDDELELTYECEYYGTGTCAENIKWTSTNNYIARVTNGIVKGMIPGNVIIKATDNSGNVLAEKSLQVLYPYTGITLGNNNSKILIGNEVQFNASTTYVGNKTPVLFYTSSNPGIISIDSETGIMSANAIGNATIEVSDPLGKYTKAFDITVVNTLENFTITNDEQVLLSDEKLEIRYTADYYGNKTLDQEIYFEVDDEDVAIIENGKVLPISSGVVTISAYDLNNNLLDSYVLEINNAFDNISLKETDYTVVLGNTSKMELVYDYLGNNTNPESLIVYDPITPEIATIDEYGNITTLKVGTAIFKATLGFDEIQLTITIKNEIENFVITNQNTSIAENTNLLITYSANYYGSNTLKESIKFVSTNEKVATIDEDGVVSALSIGTTTIQIYDLDDNLLGEIEITVHNAITSFEITNEKTEVIEGNTLEITYNASYEGVSTISTLISFVSTDESIATVDGNGIVTTYIPGTVTIKVLDTNNTTLDTIEITVLNAITSFEITNEETNIVEGKTLEITYDASYEGNKTLEESIKYESSNESIATVENGIVSTHKAGNVTIEIYDLYDNLLDELEITVVKEITEFKITNKNTTITNEDTLEITYTGIYKGTNTLEESIKFVSTNEDIATVDEDGIVTPYGLGKTTIQIYDLNDNLLDEIEVTIEYALKDLTASVKQDKVVEGSIITIDIETDYTGIVQDIYSLLNFESSDEEIATVNSVGIITTKKSGTVTITVFDNLKVYTKTVTITVVKEIEDFEFTSKKHEVEYKEQLQLEYTASYNGTNTLENDLVWTSSNNEIATVENGLVTTHKPGTVTINVYNKNDELLGTYEITVKAEVPRIELIDTKIETSMTLSGTVNYNNLCETEECKKLIRFYVDDENILSINELTGEYTGLLLGKTNIRIKDVNNTIELVIPVTVNSEITSLTYNDNESSIKVNETTKVKFTVTGIDKEKDYTDKVVITSSDETIATIENGIIKPIKPGTVTITIKDIYNSHILTYDLEIKNVIESIDINKELKDEYLVDEEIDLGVNINGTYEDLYDYLIFTSTDESVATVTDRGIINIHLAGTVTITVRDIYNTITKTKTITVGKTITNIELNAKEVTIFEGSTFKIATTIYPEDTTLDKTLEYTSLDSRVATVEDGLITAIKEGKTTIEVKTVNGIKETITVKVVGVSDIKFNFKDRVITALYLNKGESVIVNAITNSTNLEENKNITYSSSNTSIVSIDSTGKITALKGGSAYIYATAKNGCQKTMLVSVSAPITSVTLNKTTLSLEYAKTYKLIATINPSDTTQSKVLTWTSSNTAIATVNSTGLITAKKVGTAIITVKTSNGKTAKCTVTVTKVNPSSLTVKPIANYTYSASNKKPLPVVTYNGVTLKKDTHYTLAYSNNKNPGKATVTIKMKSTALYNAGNKVVNFIIVPKKVTINTPATSGGSVTAKWAKHTGVSGYVVQYQLKGTTTWLTYTTTGTSYKKTGLVKGKYYNIRVRAYKIIDGQKYFGAFSATKTVKCK